MSLELIYSLFIIEAVAGERVSDGAVDIIVDSDPSEGFVNGISPREIQDITLIESKRQPHSSRADV